MYLDNLDRIDRQLVELLLRNARMSYSDLGAAVGLSRVAARARVAALEERGVIESYTAVIDPQKLGGTVSCYLELETRPASFRQVCDTLAASELVTKLYQVTGRCRLHVHVVAASQEELEGFLAHTVRSLPDVEEFSCSIILSRIKDVKGLRL